MSTTKETPLKLQVGGYAKLTKEAAKLYANYGAGSETPYRIVDYYIGRWYLNIPTYGNAYFTPSSIIACEPPVLPEAGDYVVCDATQGTVPAQYNNYKMYRILSVEKGTNPVVCRTNHPTAPRQVLYKFKKVDPEKYVEPQPDFAVGDLVILPEKNEQQWVRSIGPRGVNQRMLVTAVVYSPAKKKFFYTLATDDRSYNIATYLDAKAWGLTIAPKGWSPREIPIDLRLLKLENVGLTNPPFASCCGAQIIYNFYGATPGSVYNLRGSDASGRALPPIRVTQEHMAAAIKNHCKSKNTGVILSVLATTQIAEYGPMLESCGFTKIKEYPNLNHGPSHMNALYGYFCHEQREKSKVEEKKRAFG